MALQAKRLIIPVLLFAGIQLFMVSFPLPALTDQALYPSPWSLLEQHRDQILQLSSDDEALAFFQSLPPFHVTNSRSRHQTPLPTQDMEWPETIKEAISTYLAALAATAYARDIRTKIMEPTVSPSLEIIPGESQRQWMVEQASLQPLTIVTDLYRQVSAWSQITAPPLSSGTQYGKFTSFYDHTYPDGSDHPLSWIRLFQEHGQKGIESRLRKFWQTPDQSSSTQSVSEVTHEAFAQQYIRSRLLPLFRAALLSQTTQMEAIGYETARTSWHHIQQWQQKNEIKSAAARLCGTWRWIVHNHQNHGDHKATITFSAPDDPAPPQIQPTTIKIQGDTVYLQWTFPQGIQEDSLLLSNRDTHLAGTFKNSLGPHGSISGKRLSTCRSS